MNPDRRSFLQNFGVGALGALALSSPARAAATAPLPPFPTGNAEAYWRAVRAQFPLLDNPTYLNVGGLGPTPQPVLDKVFSTMLQLQEHSETGYALIEPARETLARYTGVKPHEICFTRNATEATSIIAAGLKPSQPARREGQNLRPRQRQPRRQPRPYQRTRYAAHARDPS
jgi:hypothetical protein